MFWSYVQPKQSCHKAPQQVLVGVWSVSLVPGSISFVTMQWYCVKCHAGPLSSSHLHAVWGLGGMTSCILNVKGLVSLPVDVWTFGIFCLLFRCCWTSQKVWPCVGMRYASWADHAAPALATLRPKEKGASGGSYCGRGRPVFNGTWRLVSQMLVALVASKVCPAAQPDA